MTYNYTCYFDGDKLVCTSNGKTASLELGKEKFLSMSPEELLEKMEKCSLIAAKQGGQR